MIARLPRQGAHDGLAIGSAVQPPDRFEKRRPAEPARPSLIEPASIHFTLMLIACSLPQAPIWGSDIGATGGHRAS